VKLSPRFAACVRLSSGIVVGGFAFSACVSRAAGARSLFSEDAPCPEDRTAVRAAPALAPAEQPSADITADPERLAIWKAKEARLRAAAEGETYYVAVGCGQERIYRCYYCVDTPAETVCGGTPNCDAEASCHESREHPGYVVCGS